MNARSSREEGRRRATRLLWTAVLAAALLALVGSVAAASDSTDPRLSATLVGPIEAGAEGRIAVRWDGPAGALLDLWVDLDGDGVPASWELVAEGRPLTPGIEVVSFDLPPGVEVSPEAKVWVRARTDGWCDAEAIVAGAAAGEDGVPCAWQPGFHLAGLDGTAYAMAVFDDGSGPALYVGGEFTAAGDQVVNHIARWDGSEWSDVGGGIYGYFPYVSALAVFDDGSGPALYVGGQFSTAGGVDVSHIARWDGSSWSALSGPSGTGVWGGEFVVDALAVYDEGSGPALFAGGGFTTAGGVNTNNIARWDGSEWSDVGGGVTPGYSSYVGVDALAVFDPGSGETLFVGGAFLLAGGVPSASITAWRCPAVVIFADGFEDGTATAWSHTVP